MCVLHIFVDKWMDRRMEVHGIGKGWRNDAARCAV